MSDEHCSRCAQWRRDFDEMVKKREALEADSGELNALFELQHKRSIEAIQHWRKENPRNLPNVDLVSPDLGELLTWLMKKAGLES